MTTSEIRENKLNDLVVIGIRLVVGVIFILHGYSKIGNENFVNWLPSLGIPVEFQMLIILAEIVPGILIIIGVLSRVSSAVISILMISIIFHVKEAASITGKDGVEFDLILLATVLVIMIMGPGRISLSYIIKKLPRYIH